MQKELEFKKYTSDEAQAAGHPKFNDCNHYVVDMSHLRGSNTEIAYDDRDWMNTIVIQLPFGLSMTLCVMQTGKNEVCVDTAFHGENLNDHWVNPMGNGNYNLPFDRSKPYQNRNIYGLIAHAKKID
jgi:hypothetical protein